jgi:hypothetical protein
MLCLSKSNVILSCQFRAVNPFLKKCEKGTKNTDYGEGGGKRADQTDSVLFDTLWRRRWGNSA